MACDGAERDKAVANMGKNSFDFKEIAGQLRDVQRRLIQETAGDEGARLAVVRSIDGLLDEIGCDQTMIATFP